MSTPEERGRQMADERLAQFSREYDAWPWWRKTRVAFWLRKRWNDVLYAEHVFASWWEGR